MVRQSVGAWKNTEDWRDAVSKQPGADVMPDDHYDSLADVERWYWWQCSRLDRAEKLLRMYMDPQSMHAVDLGCGTGGFIADMHERCGFRHAAGYDVSEFGINRCPVNDVTYGVVKPGDYSVIARADVGFLMDVLEHVPDDSALLTGICDALPVGSFLLVSVPAHPCFFSEWDSSLGHYRRYTRSKLSRMAQGAGFSVLHTEYAFMVAGVAIGLRRLGLFSQSAATCEFPRVPSWLNTTLIVLNRWEGRFCAACQPPFGGSVFAVLQKPII